LFFNVNSTNAQKGKNRRAILPFCAICAALCAVQMAISNSRVFNSQKCSHTFVNWDDSHYKNRFFESPPTADFQKTDFGVSSTFGAGNTKIGFIMRITVKLQAIFEKHILIF